MKEDITEALYEMMGISDGDEAKSLAYAGWTTVSPGLFERSMSGKQSIYKDSDTNFLVHHSPVGFARGLHRQGRSDSLKGAMMMANAFAAGGNPSSDDDVGRFFGDLREAEEQAKTLGKPFAF